MESFAFRKLITKPVILKQISGLCKRQPPSGGCVLKHSPCAREDVVAKHEETAKTAQKDGFDYFTTTLSISPHKNAQVLNQIGLELEESYSVKYLCSDFKKKNGYKRSCELSEIYGLYRQNYCGCIYSKLEADERERAKNNNEQPLSVQ